MPTETEPVALVAHDAGGAELLSSYARRIAAQKLYVLGGPAIPIFERKEGPIQHVALQSAIESASWVLCSTSWQSDLEWQALQLAREAGKHSISFLDHWVNYRERFEHNGGRHLPDELWVADCHAERIAKACFPSVPLRLMGNPYFDDIISELNLRKDTVPKNSGGATLLYICEPISEHALAQLGDERRMGYVEHEAVDYFFHNIKLISPRVGQVVMRPHPSEPQGKYDWVLDRRVPPVRISSNSTLIEDLALADVVVGCESMAMVIALLAKKRVISTIPPGGVACALPYPEIESLQSIVEARLK